MGTAFIFVEDPASLYEFKLLVRASHHSHRAKPGGTEVGQPSQSLACAVGWREGGQGPLGAGGSPHLAACEPAPACGFEAQASLASGKPNPLAACPFLPQKSSLWRLRAAPGRDDWGSRTPTREPAHPQCGGEWGGSLGGHVQEAERRPTGTIWGTCRFKTST